MLRTLRLSKLGVVEARIRRLEETSKMQLTVLITGLSIRVSALSGG